MNLVTMGALLPLDAHAHLDPARTSEEIAASGAVLAMSGSLDEAARGIARREPRVAWGVGCHPRNQRGLAAFDQSRFRELAERTAVVGEIGLDMGGPRFGSSVPMETQLRVFREVLEALWGLPRFISLHAFRAEGPLLDELERRPVAVPILHWWTGRVAETRRAVDLGCYFSLHSAVARNSKFRLWVPPERVLVESDHGYRDPPSAIPCRVEWVEHLVGQQYGVSVEDVRRLCWRNLATIVRQTGTAGLLPPGLVARIAGG